MTLRKKFERLKEKPASTRIAILMSTVGIVMAAIIGIWVLQLEYEFGAHKTSNTTSLFGSMWNTLKNAFENARQ